MKRFSRRATIEGIRNNTMKLRYNEWFTLHAGWKVEDSESNIIGYVTDIDAYYIRNAFEPGELKESKGFSNKCYTYNK